MPGMRTVVELVVTFRDFVRLTNTPSWERSLRGWRLAYQRIGVIRVVIGWRKSAAARIVVGLTTKPLSCAARAHVATAARHAACLHLKRAMRAA